MKTPLPIPLKLGLVGWSVQHSLSPRIHNAALKALHIDGEYALYSIAPSPPAQDGLQRLIRKMRSGELHGLNVTIPHKEAIIPLMDELTPTARAVGAVNTIIHRGGKLLGENTDAPAFEADLEEVGAMPARHDKRKALILGAGGAARAVVYALINAGWQVTVAARRIEQGLKLASGYEGSLVKVAALPTQGIRYEDDFALIVNATPLGTFPHTQASPWPDGIPFPAHAFIYDLVYNPVNTSFVESARRQGLSAVTGMGMLIEQAALAFEQWTGLPAPREAMRQAVNIDLEAG